MIAQLAAVAFICLWAWQSVLEYQDSGDGVLIAIFFGLIRAFLYAFMGCFFCRPGRRRNWSISLMNKPDWKDSPDWAQWLACDNSGQWWWFSHKPVPLNHIWDIEQLDGLCECAHEYYRIVRTDAWRETLERRQ